MGKIVEMSERVEVRLYERIMTAEERTKFEPDAAGKVVGAEIVSLATGHVYLSKEIFCIDEEDADAERGIVRRCALTGLSWLWGQGRPSFEPPVVEPSADPEQRKLDALLDEMGDGLMDGFTPLTGPLTPEERVFIGLRPSPLENVGR